MHRKLNFGLIVICTGLTVTMACAESVQAQMGPAPVRVQIPLRVPESLIENRGGDLQKNFAVHKRLHWEVMKSQSSQDNDGQHSRLGSN